MHESAGRCDRYREGEMSPGTRLVVEPAMGFASNQMQFDALALASDGIATDAIHGNKSQNARTRALADFKSGKVVALIATEVAARGLDIKDLPHVVNYELPNVPEDYVHRIGRTGRAGATGSAVSLVAGDEVGLLKSIERLLGHPIQRLTPPPFIAPKIESVPQVAVHRPLVAQHARPASPRPRNQHQRRRNEGNSQHFRPHRAR